MFAHLQAETLSTRLEDLVDARLHTAFWDGAAHFGTTDLLVLYDERDTTDPLNVIPRIKMLAASSLPDSIKVQIRVPACQKVGLVADSGTPFWFIGMFTNGKSCCIASQAEATTPCGQV